MKFEPGVCSKPTMYSWSLVRSVGVEHEMNREILRYGSVELPVFILPNKVSKLAEQLSAVVTAVPGVGKRNRPALARALRNFIGSRAPIMARAWCDTAQQ